MLNLIYDNLKTNLDILTNPKIFIQNIIYQFNNDKNISYFLNNILDNAKNYDNFNNIIKYCFEKDIKISFNLFNKLMYGFKNSIFNEKINIDKIESCCTFFSDNNGKILLKYFGYIPLINFLYKKVKYNEIISSYVDLKDNMMGLTVEEFQEKILFSNDKWYKKQYPEDKDFINYKLRNKFVESFKKNNDINKINNDIKELVEIYNNNDISKIGKVYFFDFIYKKEEFNIDNLKKKLIKEKETSKKKFENNLNKLIEKFYFKVEKVTNSKIINKGNLKFKEENEELDFIYELTNLKFKNNINNIEKLKNIYVVFKRMNLLVIKTDFKNNILNLILKVEV